jgi:ABC-type proline/glycine betaine transport system substrate-binding protein
MTQKSDPIAEATFSPSPVSAKFTSPINKVWTGAPRGEESRAPAAQELDTRDASYDWENLSSQERAMWTSVFGSAYVYARVSELDVTSAHQVSKRHADDAVRAHRDAP